MNMVIETSAKKRILVIDNEDDLVELITEVLKSQGFQTDHAFKGEDGINKALVFQPHLIFLDVMMPGMNGWNVCKALRSYHQILDVPIVLMTALDRVDVEDRAALVGATDILGKPFAVSGLIDIVNKNLYPKKKSMNSPIISDRKPVVLTLEAGSYHWCRCGRSKKQPFCDGAHKGTEFSPMEFKLEAPKKVALCQCKHTKNPPYCDGTHAKI